MDQVFGASAFSLLDWAVVAVYFGIVTWVGHKFSKEQSGAHSFFLGGRSLPWYAVSASMVATAISGVTFIGVPSIVFASTGDFTYLQFAIGGIIAKWLLGHFFLPRLYEKHYYSPYDFIKDKLGPAFGKISALLFFMGGVLGQSVRVYAVALVLELMTGLNIFTCISLITGFSIVHTWMGGIKAVVWTDFVQFFVFIAGGVLSIAFASRGIEGGLTGIMATASEAGKTHVFNFALDKNVSFTFWAALIGMPFQNLAAFATDQLNTQRLLCCKNSHEAKKALYWSNISECITLLFLIVGASLFVFYNNNVLPEGLATMVAEKGDRIFPAFIISVLPSGLKGLLIAGIFAAAMSSLDSVLAALSQTSITMFNKDFNAGTMSDTKVLSLSRALILFWGAILALVAWTLSNTAAAIVPLAFTMTAYTYGPMLGLFLLAALVPKERIHSLGLGVTMSILVVLLINKPSLLCGVLNASQGFCSSEGKSLVAFPWLFPVGSLTCVIFSMLPINTNLARKHALNGVN
ncbi:sodium/solute symporter [bacterium]|nr:sodium/solute symporter [bacterium]